MPQPKSIQLIFIKHYFLSHNKATSDRESNTLTANYKSSSGSKVKYHQEFTETTYKAQNRIFMK